jgi:antitoxin component of RelBE/YafQ-DinJ toxin-antitoxin module
MNAYTVEFDETNNDVVKAILTALKGIKGIKVKEITKPEVPNKETLKAIEDAETGKNCKIYKNSKEMFKSLGINV